MSVVIVGAGHAGLQVADSLRSEGYQGVITVLDDGEAPPYQRPPLSKDYLLPGKGAEPLPLRPESFFEGKQVTLRRARVVGIDRDSRHVRLAEGQSLPYERLVIATGARPRELSCPGSKSLGIHALKTLSDAEALHAALPTAKNVVVIGAGFIGLEFAAAAKRHGCRVTVLEFAPRPMGRALSPATSAWFTRAHHQMGVDLRLGEGITEFHANGAGDVTEAVSTTGAIYPADLVVTGIGVLPNDGLASAAGLHTENGIVVDDALRTSDPRILAVGDCANFPNIHTGSRTRLESVQNATDQARHAARTIVAPGEPYTELPWFWSIQGPHRLQIAGIPGPEATTITIGEPDNDKFSVLSFHDGKLVAVESVNAPADHTSARRLLSAGAGPTPTEATAPGFSLRNYAKQELASVAVASR